MKNQLIFGHIATLLTGGGIYVLFRTSSLKMFAWYEILGLGGILNGLRPYTLSLKDKIPDWVLFSLPDGLWVFSYVCLMLLVWGNLITKKSIFWILTIPFLAIGSELGQFIGLVSGTFDPIDLVLYVLGGTLPFVIFAPPGPDHSGAKRLPNSRDRPPPRGGIIGNPVCPLGRLEVRPERAGRAVEELFRLMNHKIQFV